MVLLTLETMKKCSGEVKLENNSAKDGTLAYNNYRVKICCFKYKKEYVFKNGKTYTNETDNCTYAGEDAYVENSCVISLSDKSTGWLTKDVTASINGDNEYSFVSLGLSDSESNRVDNLSKTLTISDTSPNSSGTKVYGELVDHEGNVTKCNVTVKIDKTAPSVPVLTNPSKGNWTSSSVKITAASSDNLSVLAYYEYRYATTGSWTKVNSTATSNALIVNVTDDAFNKTLYVRSCDNAGNCSDAASSAIKIKKSFPTTPTVSLVKFRNNSDSMSDRTVTGYDAYTNNTWSTMNVHIVPTSTDPSGNTPDYYYTTTGATENKTDEKATYRNIKAEGTSTIKWKACDYAGNCSGYSSVYTVKIDKYAPTKPTLTNPSGGNWTNSNVKITAASSDSYSGIGYYQYHYSGTTTWTKVNSTATSNVEIVNVTTNKNDILYVRACDNVGNCSDAATTTIKVDKTAPSISISNPKNNVWSKTNFALTLITNENGSGVQTWYYTYNANASSVGTNANTNWITYGSSNKKNFTTTDFSAERNQYVYIRVCDIAGNCSSDKTRTMIDKTLPRYTGYSVTYGCPPLPGTGSTYGNVVSFSDNLSGHSQSTSHHTIGGSFFTPAGGDGNTSWAEIYCYGNSGTYHICDKAGNCRDGSLSF